MAPNSSVKVTCISKQYFVLGQLDGSLQSTASGKGNYHLPLTPIGSLHLGLALPFGHSPEGWLQIFLSKVTWFGSHWHKISGYELKLQIQSFIVGAKALARNNIKHLIWDNCFLFTLFGTQFVHHQWGSLSDVGMPPTWEKGSHLPPRTTKLGKLRDSHDSATAPTVRPDLGFSSQ